MQITAGHGPRPADLAPAATPAGETRAPRPEPAAESEALPPMNFDAMPPFVPGQSQIQEYLDLLERSIIEQALNITRYNRTQAAKLLGISFRSMRYRMERLNIE